MDLKVVSVAAPAGIVAVIVWAVLDRVAAAVKKKRADEKRRKAIDLTGRRFEKIGPEAYVEIDVAGEKLRLEGRDLAEFLHDAPPIFYQRTEDFKKLDSLLGEEGSQH